jgi:AsmA protein
MLEGELKLSFFPSLGISTGKIELSNAQGFEGKPFATLQESVIKINLLPLFTKQIETGGLVVKNVVLNLTRNKEGANNWDDLTKRDQTKTTNLSVPESEKPAESDFFKTVAIGAITIENAQLNWDNQQTGKRLEIKNITLKTDEFRVNEPIALDLSFLIVDTEAKLTESIKFVTALTVKEKFDHIVLGHSDLHSITDDTTLSGKSVVATMSAEVVLDLPNQSLKVSGLELKSGELNITAEISGTNIKDHPSFQGPVRVEQFSPAKILNEWAVALPMMQDTNALSKMAIGFDLQTSADSVDFQNVLINLDDTRIQGSIQLRNLVQPAFAFYLEADTIDADRYLPPATSKKDKPISSPASALAVGASLVPIETLKRLNANGELSLQKLKISDLTLQDMHLKFDAKNGLVTTQQSVKQFYQGSYSGDLSIDARNSEPALALNETISHVQIEPLLKDYKGEAKISGIVNASAQLQGQGKYTDLFKSSLNGQLNFQCKNGVIKGFNLQKIIDNVKALVKGSSIPVDRKNDQTLFSDMTGTANVKQGLIQNDDLLAKSSKLLVNGKGNANLNTEQLDYQVTARLIKTEATATEPEQLHDTPVVVHIGGTFSAPTYTLDVASLLTEKNKAKIEKILDKNKDKIDKLMDKLDKKLGPGTSDLLKHLF